MKLMTIKIAIVDMGCLSGVEKSRLCLKRTDTIRAKVDLEFGQLNRAE